MDLHASNQRQQNETFSQGLRDRRGDSDYVVVGFWNASNLRFLGVDFGLEGFGLSEGIVVGVIDSVLEMEKVEAFVWHILL